MRAQTAAQAQEVHALEAKSAQAKQTVDSEVHAARVASAGEQARAEAAGKGALTAAPSTVV